jgi:ADP-dependent NAD(P)H-hydrate dehydratase / NAD(P)H-hydrate epimerase
MAVPVISIAAMREWESATWAAGQTEAEVIRRVGHRVAARAGELTSNGDSILILAGKGHNGDDARAAATHLQNRKVKVLELLSPETDLPALEAALKENPASRDLNPRWDASRGEASSARSASGPTRLCQPALIIDGLFGIGLNRPLSEAWQKIIFSVNAAKIPVLAVDLPSGLNADTGEHFGAAIEAAVTLTVGAPKIGMLAPPASKFVGRLEVAGDIGLVPCPLAGELNWTLADDFENFPPRRGIDAHKGTFGHLAIIAGSLGYHGAAVLATRGALRAQPGLVTLFTQENIYFAVATQLQSAMLSLLGPAQKFPETTTALLAGPGLAVREVQDKLRISLQHWWRDLGCPVAIDASALDLLAVGPVAKNLIRVITPHPGEAARLLGWTPQKVQAGRLAALRELSRKFGNCWVVLKGHHTLIGRAEGEVFVNSSGNPHLAQGGSGDLLSGFIAGLLAQPALQSDVGKTLRYAVWQHGAAADKLQNARANWTIEDLAAEIGNA